MLIYLFRHGETDCNIQRIFQGALDVPLNERGQQQARDLLELLRDKGLQYLYSSPLKRAHKTAEIIAQGLGISVEDVEGLREIDGGDYAGRLMLEMERLVGEERYKSPTEDFQYPGGESKLGCRKRFVDTVLRICRQSSYECVGIAAHGFVIREMLRHFNFANKNGMNNCEVIRASYDKDKDEFMPIERITAPAV